MRYTLMLDFIENKGQPVNCLPLFYDLWKL